MQGTVRAQPSSLGHTLLWVEARGNHSCVAGSPACPQQGALVAGLPWEGVGGAQWRHRVLDSQCLSRGLMPQGAGSGTCCPCRWGWAPRESWGMGRGDTGPFLASSLC